MRNGEPTLIRFLPVAQCVLTEWDSESLMLIFGTALEETAWVCAPVEEGGQ